MGDRLYWKERRRKVEMTRRTKRKHLLTFVIAAFLLAFFAGTVYFGKWQGQEFITGNIVLNFDKEIFKINETVSGGLELILKEGELIPADTVINVFFDNKTKQITLGEFIGDASEAVNGSFYLVDTDLEGYGDGYGAIGLKKDYPLINFQLKKYIFEEEKKPEENATKSNITENITEPADIFENITKENITKFPSEPSKNVSGESGEPKKNVTEDEEPKKRKNATEEPPPEELPPEEQLAEQLPEEQPTEETDTAGEPAPGITGATIKSDTIEGQCSAEKPFIYELEKDESVELIPGSVKLSETGEQLDDSVLTIEIESGNGNEKSAKTVNIKTDYVIKEKGFGKDYLTKEDYKIILDISVIGLASSHQGMQPLKISFEYNGMQIIEIEKQIEILNISEEENITDITNVTDITNITNITNVTNRAPILRKDIPNQVIPLNSSKTIDLFDYFYDENGDNLKFEVDGTDNITILIENSIATIIPDKSFLGDREVVFSASDLDYTIKSNRVLISVVNTTEDVMNITNMTNMTNVTLNCAGGCLYIKDSAGNNVAIFDKYGNLAIKGALIFEISSPNQDDFVIQDSKGLVVAWIDDLTGNLRINGLKTEQAQEYCSPPSNSFIIRDFSGNCVSYIDRDGNLWLKGILSENVII